jgi:hypothetical protein
VLSGLFFDELMVLLIVSVHVDLNNMSDLVRCVESQQTSFL